MNGYFLRFQIVGEVADMLLLEAPTRRLLVDISVEPAAVDALEHRRYPNRATFTITDDAMIDRFMAQISPGDVTEASGTFSQSDYVPHKTTYIDTTFVMCDFRRIGRDDRIDAGETRLRYADRRMMTELSKTLH